MSRFASFKSFVSSSYGAVAVAKATPYWAGATLLVAILVAGPRKYLGERVGEVSAVLNAPSTPFGQWVMILLAILLIGLGVWRSYRYANGRAEAERSYTLQRLSQVESILNRHHRLSDLVALQSAAAQTFESERAQLQTAKNAVESYGLHVRNLRDGKINVYRNNYTEVNHHAVQGTYDAIRFLCERLGVDWHYKPENPPLTLEPFPDVPGMPPIGMLSQEFDPAKNSSQLSVFDRNRAEFDCIMTELYHKLHTRWQQQTDLITQINEEADRRGLPRLSR